MSIIARAHRTIADINDGRSITAVDVEYYLSTSSSSLSGGAWSTTAPAWVSGKFMWSRVKTTYSTDDPTYSNAACITGADGSTGSTGTGVSSITEEFYLSTSKTAQSGGSWVTTPPTWSAGKYMWTRSKIVYTNPSSTVYTTPVCDTGWEAANEIEIGGRNYAPNSAWISDTEGWVVATNAARDPNTLANGAVSIKSQQTGLVADTYRGAYMHTDALMPVSIGDVLTASILVRVDDYTTFEGSQLAVFIVVRDSAKVSYAQSTVYTTLYPVIGDDGKWKKISSTITITGETSAYAQLAFWVRRNGTAWFACPKLERGSKATDWTQSPDEVRLGSSITLTPISAIIKTPEFRIEIPNAEEGDMKLWVNSEGAFFPKASSPTLATRRAGGVYKISVGDGDYDTLADAFDDIKGTVLDSDIVLKLGANDPGGVLRGVRGGRRVIITSGNLIERYAISTYGATLESYGSSGYKVIATTAGTYRNVFVMVGRVGDMGLAGKELSIGVGNITNSGGTGVLAVLRLYAPDRVTIKADITSVYASNTSRTGIIPADANDDDVVMLGLSVSRETSCAAGAYILYDYLKVELGNTMFNWPTAKYNVSNLEVVGCDEVDVARINLPNGAKIRNSNAILSRSEIYNTLFVTLARLRMNDNKGTCTQAVKADTSNVYVTGPAPGGTYDGSVVDTTTATISGSGSAPTTVVKALNAILTGSYVSSGWIADQIIRQGYTTSRGRHYGTMWFDMSQIPTGATVTEMKLTVRRNSTFGVGGNVTIKAYGTADTSKSGSPAPLTGPYTLGTIGKPQTKTFVLPTALRDALAAGTAKGIVFYADDKTPISGESYSANFAGFEGTDATKPVLTVTYTV